MGASIPLFYFHTRYKRFIEDKDGLDLPDVATAWRQATQMSGHILRDLDGALEPGREWRLEVTDANRRMLFALRMWAEIYNESD